MFTGGSQTNFQGTDVSEIVNVALVKTVKTILLHIMGTLRHRLELQQYRQISDKFPIISATGSTSFLVRLKDMTLLLQDVV